MKLNLKTKDGEPITLTLSEESIKTIRENFVGAVLELTDKIDAKQAGKYEESTPRAQGKLAALKDEMTKLKEKLAKLNAKVPEKPDDKYLLDKIEENLQEQKELARKITGVEIHGTNYCIY